jgi:hypothetical protein
MDGRSLYDDDIYAWAQQQAATLRRLGETRRDLPNELDLENVSEEIEDLGSNRKDAAESFIRLILVHLAKLAAAPQAASANHWRKEIVTFHNELLAKLTRSMWAGIDLKTLWRRALKEARAGLKADEAEGFDENRIFRAELQACPVDLFTLAGEDFDIEPVLNRLASRLSEAN